MDIHAARAALICRLMGSASKAHGDIADDTDIYEHLGINGWDLYEILDWVAATFGVDLSAMTPDDYDLNEPPGGLIRIQPYKPITVRELLAAIERGHWVVPK